MNTTSTKYIIKFSTLTALTVLALILSTKGGFAQWTDRSTAAGSSTTAIKGSGISSDGQTMIIVGDAGFIKTSTNGGASWTDRNTAAGSPAVNLNAADIGPDGLMVVVGDSGYIRTSADGGASWTNRNTAAGAGSIVLRAVDIGPTGTIFTVGDSSFAKYSTTDGASWATASTGIGGFILGAAVGPSDIMLAVATDGKSVSTNGGVGWGSSGTGGSDLYAAAIGPSSQMIAGGTGPSYLQTSNDGVGGSWVDRVAASGLSTHVRALAIDSSGVMYAGATVGFLKSSSNNGANWTDLSAASGIGSNDVRDIAVDSNGNLLVVGTNGYVTTYSSNTAPTITSGPSVAPTVDYAQGTRTGPSNRWQFLLTATDGQQTGSNQLTVYIHTGANRTGTQVWTATFTSGVQIASTLTYNLSGLVAGSNTLYVSVYDGTSYSATNPSFTLLRDDTAPAAPSAISTNPAQVGGNLQYTVTFTATDTTSTNSNEMRYEVRENSCAGAIVSGGSGQFTQGAGRTTGTITDNNLVGGSNTRCLLIRDGANNTSNANFTVTLAPPPSGVGTAAYTPITSYRVTLNGQANPQSIATFGHFRVFSTNPGNCNADSGGTRYPATQPSDVPVLPTDNSVHNYSYTIPLDSAAFLIPNTQYWYCAYAFNTNGTTGASGVQSFITPDGPADPCDPPTEGNLTIPTGAVCTFNGNFSGVDAGTGTRNTANLTMSSGVNMTINTGQKIGFGGISMQTGARLTLARGASLTGGGVYVHDKDGDGLLDSKTVYVGSTASASTEFVRRNLVATNYNYAWKIASAAASTDCNPNSALEYRYAPGNPLMVTDTDNDGYKTAAAAANNNCVGAVSTINGRTYYRDETNTYSILPDAQKLSASTDCQDNPNGTPCAPTTVNASNPSSQTQNSVTWSGTNTGGAVPAGTGFDLKWCTGGGCDPAAGSNLITSVSTPYTHSFTANPSATYRYAIAAKNAGAGTGAYSTSIGQVTTAASCSNQTVYLDNDLDGSGHSGTITRGVSTRGSTASGTNLIINKPADIVDGMLMVAIIEIDHSATTVRTITPPAGWTSITSVSNGTDLGIYAWYKYASSEGASYTWTFSGGADQQQGMITSFGNVRTSSPIDVVGTGTGTGTNHTVNALSLTNGNEMLVMAVANSATGDFSNPSGMTEIMDYAPASVDSLAVYTEWRTSSGTTSNKSAVFGSSQQYAAIMFAIKRPDSISTTECVEGGNPSAGWELNQNDCDDTTGSYTSSTSSRYPDNDGDAVISSSTATVCGSSRPGTNSSAGTDCNDGDGAYYQFITGYLDNDNDGTTINSTSNVCSGATIAAYNQSTNPYRSTLSNPVDCYDSNSNAEPGSTYSSSSHRGDGSWDYNCVNGNEFVFQSYACVSLKFSGGSGNYFADAGYENYFGCTSPGYNSIGSANAGCGTVGCFPAEILHATNSFMCGIADDGSPGTRAYPGGVASTCR